MARIFIDGFESGEHDLFDAESNATVVSSAGLDMDGDYCLDLNGLVEHLAKDITADDEMYFAFLYRPTASNSKAILSVWNGSAVLIHLWLNAGVIRVNRGVGTVLVDGTASISLNTTYLIEVRIKIADSGGRIETKVDSISDIDFTGDTKEGAYTQFDKVRLGQGAVASYYCSAYFDNFIMDDAAWIGDTNIQALVPTAGGNSTGWTPSAGSNFACVDEIPPSDADFVSINANNVVDTYTLADLSGSIDNIKCVQVQSRTRSEGTPTPKNLQLVVRSSGTDYFSASKSVPASEKGLCALWNTDPATSATWLEAAVNAAEIGVKSIA